MIAKLDRNRYILLIDALLIVVAGPLSFLIRLDASPLFLFYLPVLFLFIGVGLVIKLFLYWAFGLYRHFWRYASTDELLLIITAVTISSLVLTIIFVVISLPYGLISGFPRSVLVIDWLLQLIFVGGIRFLVRISVESSGAKEPLAQKSRQNRVLIAGAGDTGSIIVREMQYNPHLGIVPVAFVDDNVNKVGKRIHNIPVLGRISDIPRLVPTWDINEVIIAMPTAPGRVIREIAQACEKVNVPSKTMPGIYELISGQVGVNRLREVEIDDLLRREPVEVDEPGINSYLSDKRVLITGAGGSIGSELTRQVARYGPAQLILLGHGENSIYAISQEMQNAFLDLDIQPCIADIRDAQRIEYLFRRYQPQVVFHAAAHKHVPLMEINPCEAVANNIIGTQVILEAARQAQVERLVLISSDKAVDPTNVMGATKRIAELLVQEMAQRVRDGAGSKPVPTYVAVRFGNVLGSRGSVVPLFKQQITQGGPITITHPEMERFFMTIPEAVHLVIQAAALGRGGEIFVLDMGQPVKIVDLARDLIELSGLKPGEDIDIVFTGLRPGEKLTEELFSKREMTRPTTHPKITAIAHAAGEDDCQVQEAVMAFKQAVSRQDEGQIYTILANLLPEAKLQEMPPITHRQSSLSL